MTVVLRIFALISAFYLLAASQVFTLSRAFAGDDSPFRAVYLNPQSVTSAYDFARSEIAALKTQGKEIEGVTLLHVGQVEPKALDALVKLYRAEHIPVKIDRATPDEIEKQLDERERVSGATAWETAKLIRYEAGVKGPEAEAQKGFKLKIRQARDEIRNFLGAANGVSFSSYRIKPTAFEAAMGGTTTALVSYYIVYQPLLHKVAEGHQLNPLAAGVVAAVFNGFFGIWQRGNSAFKGQGVQYDFKKMEFMQHNVRLFFLSMLMHSLVMREAIEFVCHITDSGFTMGWDSALHVLRVSLFGVIGKYPFEMFMEKFRKVNSKWRTIGLMTCWGLFWSSVQFGDQFGISTVAGFHVGDVFKKMMFAFSVTSAFIASYKNRAGIFEFFDRLINRKAHEQKIAECQTILLYKTRNQNPDEL